MKRFFVGLVVALMAMPALAQEAQSYAGASFGQATVKGFCDGAGAIGASCDDSASGFRVFAGRQFGRNVAIEVGYVDLGSVGGSLGPVSVSLAASGLDASAIFGVPLGEKVSLFTRLGVYHLSGRVSSNVGFSESDSSTDLTFGLGLRFELGTRAALRVEWQRYSGVGDAATIGTADVDLVGAGVLFRF